jgi:hypothetical protein
VFSHAQFSPDAPDVPAGFDFPAVLLIFDIRQRLPLHSNFCLLLKPIRRFEVSFPQDRNAPHFPDDQIFLRNADLQCHDARPFRRTGFALRSTVNAVPELAIA